MMDRFDLWIYRICDYAYYPHVGDPDNGIDARISFLSLQEKRKGPSCSAPKNRPDFSFGQTEYSIHEEIEKKFSG